MLPGETLRSGASKTCDCGRMVIEGIYSSAAGWYIGSRCPRCGPYTRESAYYPTYAAAEQAQRTNTVKWRT